MNNNLEIRAGITALKIGCSTIMLLIMVLVGSLFWKHWGNRRPWQTEEYISINMTKPDYVASWQNHFQQNSKFFVNGVLFHVGLWAIGFTSGPKETDYRVRGTPFTMGVSAYQMTNENIKVAILNIAVETTGKKEQAVLKENYPVIMTFNFQEGRKFSNGSRLEDYQMAFWQSYTPIDAKPAKNEKVSVFLDVEVVNLSLQEEPVRQTLRFDFNPRVTRGLYSKRWLAK